jgi:hypothetical protein
MIKPEQIPDEVVEAAEHEACKNARPDIRAALAAGLAAWPHRSRLHSILKGNQFALILPLKETQNER